MRSARIATVATFLALLYLPGLLMATGARIVAPVDEQRTLAPAPSLHPRDWLAPGFARALQAWFDDHQGLRDLAIRLAGQLDYSLLGTSDRVHIGDDGWLFYRAQLEQGRVLTQRRPAWELERLFLEYDLLYRWLAERGVQLVVMTNPLKYTVYPEHLPPDAPRFRGDEPFQKLRSFLSEHGGIVHVDTQPLLLALKSERPVFHRTDFHWNEPAAFAVAQELVNRLGRREGFDRDLWRRTLEIRERVTSGGQARFMPMLWPLEERGLFVARFPRPKEAVHREGLWDFVTESPFEDGPLLPPGAAYTDSFWEMLTAAGVELHFESFRRARVHSSSLGEALRALPADCRYFVLQFIEGSLLEQLSFGLDLPWRRDPHPPARPAG